jgi:predicted DNA-binding transcriptional regulator AlpA
MHTTKERRTASRPKQASARLGIGLSTLWDRLKNDPAFPRPFKMGPRITQFWDDELDSYAESKRVQP